VIFTVVPPQMNEAQRRVVGSATPAKVEWSGKKAVATTSGMSRNTVITAEREIALGCGRS
jgi:hypothetical protein